MTSFDVVIPAARAERTLAAAVESALAPLVRRVFVVVDGGEKTLEVARSLARQHARVRVLRSRASGVGAARNLGLRECRADWVLFLDADDEYAPGYTEALADLIDTAGPELALVHTRILRVCGGQELDDHPLRFRFSSGSRVIRPDDEPHMIGHSMAAAAVKRSMLVESGVRVNTDMPWSEDADFMVRYLLALSARCPGFTVGFSASAVYRYRVGDAGTATVSAWADPLKYSLPFTELYLPWIEAARQVCGSLPRWLQNSLLYELCWYVEADRQVHHPSRALDRQTRRHCAELVERVLAAVDRVAVEDYALTPLSLDRRMMFAAAARGDRSVPLNGQVISYRHTGHRLGKYTYFFTGDIPREEFIGRPRAPVPASQKWVSHTLFDIEFVRERILWFEARGADHPTVRLNGEDITVAPYRGLPRLPATKETARAGTTVHRVSDPVQRRGTGPLGDIRRALWHLRHRQKKAPVQHRQVKPAARTWFYMDRAHRAGDNAEAFYRYAVNRLPEVHHVFALSRSSSDWERLSADGFTLVDSDRGQNMKEALAGAETLLVSDISDTVLAPLLTELDRHQRLVFLQHGITRKQIWRWLNPRRIDAMVTSTDDETAGIVADGSHYTLSSPQVWQTGMPRLDSLLALRRQQPVRDTLLIAPTWVPELRRDPGPARDWVRNWTSWIPGDLLAVGSPLKPVFFVHPNMEEALAGLSLPVPAVFGSGLAESLSRSVATVTDTSSIADEGQMIGVTAFMLRQYPDPLQVEPSHRLPGFTFVDGLEQMGQQVSALTRTGAPDLPILHDGHARRRLLEKLLGNS